MLVIHLSGYPAIEVFKFKAQKDMKPPIPLGQVPTFLYDDRNPYQAGSGQLIYGTLTLRCMRNSKGKHKCKESGYIFDKCAYLTFKDRNRQVPSLYTPCGNLLMTPVSNKPLPDMEHEIRMHMVLIGSVNDLPPSPFPLATDTPFHIYRDSLSATSSFEFSSTASSTLEAGILNVGKTSNALLRPTNSQTRPTASGNFQPLAASTNEEPRPPLQPQPGPSGTQRQRSRSSSPSSGTRKITLRTREISYHQLTLESYTRPRRKIIPLPRYNIPRMPVSPIPPMTPRPNKRKSSHPSRYTDEIAQPSAKRLPTDGTADHVGSDQPGPSNDQENVHPALAETLPLTTSQLSGRGSPSSFETPPLVTIDDTPPANASFGDSSSNEAGSKSKDYSQSSESPHALQHTPPGPPSPTPPSTPPSRPPSDLSSSDSKDGKDRVFFRTDTALIANASLNHAPPTSTSSTPEHVLIQVETESQGQVVQEITHILHFHTAHDSSDILRAFADNAINVELPDEGIHDSLQQSHNTSWRPPPPPTSPEAGPSSTNATFGSPEPLPRQPSIVEPSIDFDALNLSVSQNHGLADVDPDNDDYIVNGSATGEEGEKEGERSRE